MMKSLLLFFLFMPAIFCLQAQQPDTLKLPNNDIILRLADSLPMASNIFQTGRASYYHPKFEGRKTANGEIFSNDSLTAAHLTLPFGTLVKVCNVTDSSCVLVRINDRGPYSKKFSIDLSKAAAKEIGLTRTLGHIPIWIEIVETPLGQE